MEKLCLSHIIMEKNKAELTIENPDRDNITQGSIDTYKGSNIHDR